MAKELNKFYLEGEEIEVTDSKAREDIDTLDTKVDNNYNTLDDKIDSNYTTLDDKIDNEATRLDGRVDTVNDRVTSEATRLDGKINTQGVPVGGTTSQILAKTSNSDYATQWVNAPTPGPGGSDIDDSVIALNKTWSSNKTNSEDQIPLEMISKRVEDGSTFNYNYSPNILIRRNGKLYSTMKNVTIGETIVENVNIKETELRVFLTKKLNYFKTSSSQSTLKSALQECCANIGSNDEIEPFTLISLIFDWNGNYTFFGAATLTSSRNVICSLCSGTSGDGYMYKCIYNNSTQSLTLYQYSGTVI